MPSNTHFALSIVLAAVLLAVPGYQLLTIEWSELDRVIEFLGYGSFVFLGLIIVVTGFAIYIGIACMRQRSKPGPEFNYLQMDTSGLNYTRNGQSRIWAWDEIVRFRLVPKFERIEFFLPDTDQKAEKRDPWIHGRTVRGPYVVIDDIFEVSLEEILSTLNSFHQRAAKA